MTDEHTFCQFFGPPSQNTLLTYACSLVEIIGHRRWNTRTAATRKTQYVRKLTKYIQSDISLLNWDNVSNETDAEVGDDIFVRHTGIHNECKCVERI